MGPSERPSVRICGPMTCSSSSDIWFSLSRRYGGIAGHQQVADILEDQLDLAELRACLRVEDHHPILAVNRLDGRGAQDRVVPSSQYDRADRIHPWWE